MKSLQFSSLAGALLVSFLSSQFVACSADTGEGDAGFGGAAPGAGGQPVGSGGTASTAGAVGSGGAATSGGSAAQGGGAAGGVAAGGSAAGGASSSGGANAAAGGNSAGAASSGGNASGGTSSTGGSAAGGASAMGGRPSGGASGGGVSTGGAAQGGATSGGAAQGGASAGGSGTLAAVTIYIAGDSTVSNYTDTAATNDQAGWGQMLKGIFNTKVTVVNRAAGGRTAYWSHLEGTVTSILSTIKQGDYFFIQFGTNDQNTTATFEVNGTTYPRYAAADTTFKTQLKTYYLDPIRAKGAIPVLVTPPPRNSAYCNGGNGLGAYANAMIQLGTAEKVTVLDNSKKTFDYLKAICPKPTTASAETFFLGKADGTIDGTHFQENGARKMAGFIGVCIQETGLGLAPYLL